MFSFIPVPKPMWIGRVPDINQQRIDLRDQQTRTQKGVLRLPTQTAIGLSRVLDLPESIGHGRKLLNKQKPQFTANRRGYVELPLPLAVRHLRLLLSHPNPS